MFRLFGVTTRVKTSKQYSSEHATFQPPCIYLYIRNRRCPFRDPDPYAVKTKTCIDCGKSHAALQNGVATIQSDPISVTMHRRDDVIINFDTFVDKNTYRHIHTDTYIQTYTHMLKWVRNGTLRLLTDWRRQALINWLITGECKPDTRCWVCYLCQHISRT